MVCSIKAAVRVSAEKRGAHGQAQEDFFCDAGVRHETSVGDIGTLARQASPSPLYNFSLDHLLTRLYTASIGFCSPS